MLLASLLAAYLLYALVESPFMRLRERYFSDGNRSGIHNAKA
jgi:peptidoglycan/LPS O-acetylase OafA/YrhL